MKEIANLCMLSSLFGGLIALSHVPYGNARAMTSYSFPIESVKSNYTKSNYNETTADTTQEYNRRSNNTAVTALPAQTKSLEISQPTGGAAAVRIRRKKRETEVTLPYDFNTLHLPCDLDLPARVRLITGMPNQCIWTWNNKYVHEGFFRVYKTYQLEAFAFGQYYERMKRFEFDPHVFQY